jgi:hypothetical protein
VLPSADCVRGFVSQRGCERRPDKNEVSAEFRTVIKAPARKVVARACYLLIYQMCG